MRCKHCGKELPLFKKLADNDFCSAEHRELFVEAQHQLMLSRLQESGRRMRSRSLSAAQREPLVPPPPDPNPPPRPLFGYLDQISRLADCHFEAWLAAALEASPNLVVIPKLFLELDLVLAARVPLPGGMEARSGIRGIWGKSLPLVFEPFLLPPRLDRAAGQLGIGMLGRLLALPSGHPRDWRGPAIRSALAGPESPREFRCLPAGSVPLPALWQRAGSLLSLSRLAALDSATGNRTANPAGASSSLTPEVPRLAIRGGESAPGASRRLYRIRPRNAVAWAGLRAFTLVAAGEPFESQSRPFLPAADAVTQVSTLRALSRPYRMRAGGPVGAARMAPWLPISAAPDALLGFASVPPFPQTAVDGLEPKALIRLFRFRPRSGVGGGDLLTALEASAGLFNPDPSIPGASLAETAPNRVERLFKARPRTGKNDPRLPVFETWAPHAIQAASVPRAIRASACTVAAISAAPPLLTRAFRMRPRAGIADASLAVYQVLAPSAAVNEAASPAIATMPVAVAACRPQAVDKLYRMRPRAGVADPAIVYHLAIDASASIVILHPVITSLVFAGSECAPSLLDRLYRMRPRAGVSDPDAATSIADPSATSPFAPAPALPGLRAGAVAAQDGKVPPLVGKLFRMRPRAGINDPDARLQETDSRGPVSEAQPKPEAYPNAGFTFPLASLALSDRLFRMRPRAGINDPNARLQDTDSRGAVGEEQSRPEAYPNAGFAFPAASLALWDRLFRMRPRAGINDPNARLQDTDSRGAVTKAQPRPEAYPSAAFAAAPGSLGTTDRLFRMRPRGGVRGSIVVALNRPDPLHGERVARAYPGITGSIPALTAQSLCALRRLAEVPGAAEWLATSAAPQTAAAAAVRPSLSAAGCAPDMAADLFPAEPLHELLSVLAPGFSGSLSGPVEDSEIFVMPPVPELHVVHEYDLPRSDRQTRIGPPTASAGSPDLNVDSAEPLDGAMVARSMLACSMLDGFDLFRQAMAIAPGITHAPAWKRTWNSVRSAFLGRNIGGRPAAWLHAPVFRLASCGAGVLFTVILWSASYVPVSSATARVGTSAPQATPVLTAFSTTVKKGIAERSATDLREDFGSGVHDWEGDGDWASSWNYDERGGVKPGALAILKTSRTLTDYTVEFLGQIEKKALGFTIRSADTQNYQAVKLVVKSPGPLPVISIVHYAVVGGTESARQERRLSIPVFNDTIYRIRLTVRDDTFTLAVNEQVVDAWVDNRIAKGGVGFFAGVGESSRVYDMRVYHQADALGKALAYIAKKEPQGEKGISQE